MCESASRERSKHRYSKQGEWRIVFTWVILTCLDLVWLGLSRSDLTWLDSSWLDLTSITIVIIGMTLYELVLHYHIISYHNSCSFILSLLLIWSPFYSILVNFKSILFDSILFFILLNLIYYIFQYCISYQWMICVYLVRSSVCLSVCLFICMNKFMFSLLSCFFSLYPFSLFSWTSSSHTHGHGHTNTYEYMFLLMTRTYYFKSR